MQGITSAILLILVANLATTNANEKQQEICPGKVNEYLECGTKFNTSDEVIKCQETRLKNLEDESEKLTNDCKANGETKCDLNDIIAKCEEYQKQFFQPQGNEKTKRAAGIVYSSSSSDSSDDNKRGK